jgi:hypothetical protein
MERQHGSASEPMPKTQMEEGRMSDRKPATVAEALGYARPHFILVVADDCQKFEEEVNQAIVNGYEPHGEYHYNTWLDDSQGRIEQWSMALIKAGTGPL